MIVKFIVAMLKFEMFGTKKVLKIVIQAMKIHLQLTDKFIIFEWKF